MTKFLRSLLKHYRFFIPLTLLFFTTSIYFLLRSDIFLVREFIVIQHTRERFLTEDELKKQLSPYLARSLLTLNTKMIKTQLTQNNLALEKVILQKEYPDKLRVEIWERKPVAIVNHWVVDKEGLLFHEASSRHRLNLPQLKLSPEKNYQLGSQLNGTLVQNALKTVETLGQIEGVSLESLYLESTGTLKVITQGKAEILIDGGKPIEQQLTSLQAIIKDAQMTGKNFSRIDLRFAKPVVVYR